MEDQNTQENIEAVNSDFAAYPFPKKLKIAIKLGYYRLHNAENQGFEDVAAQNAKDALTKTTFQKVGKIIYLGFIDKVILSQSEILNESAQEEIQTEEEAK